MQGETDVLKIQRFMQELGQEATGPGRVYLTGGATALLLGWREMTADLEFKFDPEPPGAFAAIRILKERLDMNVELASPDQFIPELPGWRSRGRFVVRHGEIDFFHYDLYAQALAKIERGHRRDLTDVQAMFDRGFIEPVLLRTLFDSIQGEMERYPAITADAFRRKLDEALSATGAAEGEEGGDV